MREDQNSSAYTRGEGGWKGSLFACQTSALGPGRGTKRGEGHFSYKSVVRLLVRVLLGVYFWE